MSQVTQPPDEILAWAASTIASDGTLAGVEQLRTFSGPWMVRVEHDGVVTEAILKCGSAVDWRNEYSCELAGLELAARNGIPVPRSLGSHLDVQAPDDPVALLIERLPGTTAIPVAPETDRLRSLGRTAALLHRIPLTPSERLPLRERHTSWTDFSTWRRWAKRYRETSPARRDAVVGDFVVENPGWSVGAVRKEFEGIETTPLLDEADDRVYRTRIGHRPSVFVHGDLWQGNTLWSDGRCTGVIDWEAAGTGHPGVDLGCLRWDAAIAFGEAADIDVIIEGWEDAMGERAADVAYWDAVAALNVPADLGRLVPALTEHGRGDLDGPTLNERSNAFLEAALDALLASNP